MTQFRFREPSNKFLYLLDGDQWALNPGVDFECTVEAFRAKLAAMCRRRHLRYRTAMYNGLLYVEVYRDTPGDIADENPELNPDGFRQHAGADAPPEPSDG